MLSSSRLLSLFLSFVPVWVFLGNCVAMTTSVQKPQNAESMESEVLYPNVVITQTENIPTILKTIETSTKIVYFELPDSEIGGELDSSFGFEKRISNPRIVDRIKFLVTKNSPVPMSSLQRGKECSGAYSSAIQFLAAANSETILFSYKCGIAKLQKQNLYFDVMEERVELERLIRDLRNL